MKKTALFSDASPLSFFRRGFTLIELVIVISIIAILSTIALFGFSKAQASGRDASRDSTMNSLRSALERYYADNQKYPTGGFGSMIATLKSPVAYLSVSPTDPSAAICTGTIGTGSWEPCGSGKAPKYVYDSSTTAYVKGATAGCSLAGSCYYLWLTTESSGQIHEFGSPQ